MSDVPPRKPRRYGRWLWLAAGTGLVVLWLARGPLLSPVVARIAAARITEATGAQTRIARASGGWIGDAQFHGVELAGMGWRVRVQRIEAEYGFGLLRGDAAALRSLSLSGVDATLDLDGLPASGGQQPWPAVLAQLPERLPRLRLDGDVALRAGGHQLLLAGLDLAIADGRVRLASRQMSFDGRIYALPPLQLSRAVRDSLRLDEPVELPFQGGLRCDHLELTLGSSAQQLLADGQLGGGTWRARFAGGTASIELQGIDVATLGLLPPDLGAVLVDGSVERSAEAWRVRSLHVAANGLALDASTLVEAGPWRCRELVATLAADLEKLRPGLHGRIQATLRGDLPLAQWTQGRLDLAVSGSDFVVGGKPCAPLRLEARLEDGAVRLQALDGGWGGYPVRLQAGTTDEAVPQAAAWRLMPRPIGIAGGVATLAAHGDAGGSVAGELRLDGLLLAELPLASSLRHVRGTVAGQFRFDGRLTAPDWAGELRLEGVEAKLSTDIPTITGGRARLLVEPGLLTITELHGEMGGAGMDASGGIRLDGAGGDLDLVCRGRNLLLVQRPDARVRADLDLRLGGSFASPLLSGEVVVTSALITPELPGGGQGDLGDDRIVLFELPDPPLSTLRFALQVRSAAADGADRGVRVATRWGRGTCDLDLRLGGTGALPTPEGRVSVRDGVATLPFSTLKVTHGELVFPPGDPFQPRLTATAGARIRNYDVVAQVTGTLSQPVIRVTGSGLDEQEALMLLTTGSTPRELADPQSQKAALGRVGVWLGQEAWRDLEGLDGVDDGPSLTERVVITWGRERSGQGRDTIDTEVELTEPGSDPAVLLYGERDRYDQYNAGVILRLSWGGEDP